LWLLDSHIDYDTHFPLEYEAGHTAGLRLLWMAAAPAPCTAGTSRVALRRARGAHFDHVIALARFPGFSELKRSWRERVQLRPLGGRGDEVGVSEDWHAQAHS
jgi:hypothetical protein